MIELVRCRIVQFAKGLALAGLVALGACGGGGGGTEPTPTRTLQSIAVTPANPSVVAGLSTSLTATATYSDSTTENVTTQVAWSSSDAAVATVGAATGSVFGVKAGTATMTATLSGVSGTGTVTVTPATLVSIGITPASPTIAAGTQQQFVATGTYTDSSTQDLSSQVAWASSASAVATIGSATGLATGVAAGSANITASLGGVASTPVALTVTNATLVSLAVTPSNPSIALGTSQQMTATGVFSDNNTQDLTTQVTWASSATAVATVGQATGLATPVAIGSANITAAMNGVTSAPVPLTVTAATLVSISVDPPVHNMFPGQTQQFTATGVYSDASIKDLTASADWASSAASVATVGNSGPSKGLLNAVAVGTTNVTAALGGVTSAPAAAVTVSAATLVSISVQFDQGSASVPLGSPVQLKAVGVYSDNKTQDLTEQVAWTSSALGVATVSTAAGTKGKVTTLAAGSTTLTATYGGVAPATTALAVTSATLQSIGINRQSVTLALGTGQQYVAIGTYSDNSRQDLTSLVTWKSDTAGPATISNADGSRGWATGDAPGTTNITATLGSVTSPAAYLRVTNATLGSLAVLPASPNLAVGGTRQLTAMGTFSDGSQQDLTEQVTWFSSAAAVAPVANVAGSQGQATALALGTTNVHAVRNAVTAPAVTLTVTAALGYTYVVNEADNTVSQYLIGSDGALAPMSTATVATGHRPVGIQVAPGGRYAYVSNYDDGTISQYAIGSDGALAPLSPATVPAGLHPRGIAIHPSGQYAYVTNRGDGTTMNDTLLQYTVGSDGKLTAMTPATVPTGGTPYAVAVDPSGRYAYVANYQGSTVTQYTIGASGALAPMGVPSIAAGVKPSSLTVDANGHVYVTNFCESCGSGGDSVSQYTMGADGSLSAMTPATVTTAASPFGMALTPDGQYAYVASTAGYVVSQFSVGAGGSLAPLSPATLPGVGGPAVVAVDPSGKYVYVANYNDRTVSQFTIGAGGTLTAMAAPTVTAGFNATAIVTVAAR